MARSPPPQNGRAACRGRGEISVGGASFKKKKRQKKKRNVTGVQTFPFPIYVQFAAIFASCQADRGLRIRCRAPSDDDCAHRKSQKKTGQNPPRDPRRGL